MESTFAYASKFNSELSEWDVFMVGDMKYMFQWAEMFNQDIGQWDVSRVDEMVGMFANAHSFNQDISGWDMSKVYDMNHMFEHSSLNQNLCQWGDKINSDANVEKMFQESDCPSESDPNLDSTPVGPLCWSCN